MDVIAEGIESGYEAETLVDLGAEYGLGLHYSPGLDTDAFIANYA